MGTSVALAAFVPGGRMPEPTPERDVFDENPQTRSLSRRSPSHQVVSHTDGTIHVACGRTFDESNAPVSSAWSNISLWNTCQQCARRTGLLSLRGAEIVELFHEVFDDKYYVEIDDGKQLTDKPTVELSPQDPDHYIPGRGYTIARHFGYVPGGTTSDHRGAPIVMLTPRVAATVRVL